MKILIKKPPVYDDIVSAGMQPNLNVIYTYGDTIYNPSNVDIPDDLLVHEEVHSVQQGNDPDKWWSRYLDDQYFRIDQEAEAYGKQYDFVCGFIKDRNQRARFLNRLAMILSSPVYGNVITQANALKTIKQKSKNNG